MKQDRTIPRETLERMVETVRPDATVRGADPARDGHLAVYHLTLETPSGTEAAVLKASPDGERHGIDTEARLLSIVADRTAIPVPEVLGAVDQHDALPAPFFLMERVEGEKRSKRAIGDLSDAALETLCRESGRHLAELHALESPTGYGQVEADPSQRLSGGRPPADPDRLTLTALQGGRSTDAAAWPSVLRTWAEDTLDRLDETRFADLHDDVAPVVLDRIESLAGPFEPALGRIDHGLHNVLLADGSGSIAGVIDWAFTLTVPPAYDLVCVEANLSLGPWAVHPDAPDRRDLVRDALLEGYRTVGGPDVPDRLRRHRSTYELLALLRAMNHLDTVPGFVMPEATDRQVDDAAVGYRELVADNLGSA